ncbi:MAG TPA: helix-turn-helix transcriptional regulator [Trinickia sp.]|jgi:transcriptional regulator with XRE-family HTH domain|nr:helix-turn-helix transcriptional regulator [Trinickia sp.]
MSTPKNELGNLLRSRRRALSPVEHGITDTSRRKTPGLRREEVAELAGISVDWYTRLEQGRDVTPSPGTLAALARALRLNDAETEHMKSLSLRAQPARFERESVPETVRALLAQLNVPAYVTGRRWDVLAWNAHAAELITDFSRFEEEERNILFYMLTDMEVRATFVGWENEARRMVSQFRPMYDAFCDDPAFIRLVAALTDRSPEFRAWWKTHEVRGPRAGEKHLQHPRLGNIAVEYVTFQASQDPALKLVLYTQARPIA